MEPDAAAADDYMGDLSHFLPPSPSASPSRTLVGRRKQPTGPATQPAAAAQPRAKRAKGVPWRERRRQELERRQLEEDARTMAGLAVAIPESNVGFRMLKRMGYDPGARGAGAEPVGIEIRRSRAGLGAEPAADPAPAPVPVEVSREAVEREMRRQEEMAVELRARKSTQWRGRRVVWDFRKAQAALAQLENREVEPPAPEGENQKEAEEEEEVITEEDLQNILVKLRDHHHYCLYCGCKYESAETLANECPGANEDDH